MSRKNPACLLQEKLPCCTSISCLLQNLVENLGSWLLDVILLSLLPSAYVSTFQLNLYLKKPCQILQSAIFPSVHLCCSSAAGEANFPPGMETQGWSLLKRTSSWSTGHRRICSCFVSTSGLLLFAGFGARCWNTLVGCWFSLISSDDALISAEAGSWEFGCVWDKLTLPSLHRPQHRLRGWSLFRVLQNCLHCAWLQLGS